MQSGLNQFRHKLFQKLILYVIIQNKAMIKGGIDKMSIIENITKKVAQTAKTAAKKSGEIVEITRLNINIASEEEKIDKIYIEIGKKVYSAYLRGEEVDESFRMFCEQIKIHEENIQSIKKKILEVKNAKVCVSCNTEIETNAIFCPKCGSKQEEKEKTETHEKNICPQCGAKVEPKSAYCMACGNKM